MTTEQELKLFRALRLTLRIVCVLLYNQIRFMRNSSPVEATLEKQNELQQEASLFAQHEL